MFRCGIPKEKCESKRDSQKFQLIVGVIVLASVLLATRFITSEVWSQIICWCTGVFFGETVWTRNIK